MRPSGATLGQTLLGTSANRDNCACQICKASASATSALWPACRRLKTYEAVTASVRSARTVKTPPRVIGKWRELFWRARFQLTLMVFHKRLSISLSHALTFPESWEIFRLVAL